MTLHCTRLAALENKETALDLVLLHGWGMGSNVWQGWLPLLRQRFNLHLIDLPGYGGSDEKVPYQYDAIVAAIINVAPSSGIYLGYSLGGMLAVKLAAQHPEKVTALILLATNTKFVADAQWPWAMPETVFQQFHTSLNAKPQQALSRFMGLQIQGGGEQKTLLKAIRSLAEPVTDGTLCSSLDLLASLNITADINSLTLPALMMFGENDNLVPVAVAEHFSNLALDIETVESAPHAFFISHAQTTLDKIQQFLVKKNIASSLARDKKQVARSFSRAAETYDGVAEFQRLVGKRLLDFLPEINAETVLDLGCGTGFFTPQLQSHYPGSNIVGLDLAEGMVRYSSARQLGNWLCADAESLPLAANSIDIIYSSLAIQWCENNTELFSEIFRVLKPGGRFIFSTLGPQSLHELRSAWSVVDDYVHVNRFAAKELLLVAIKRAGFDNQHNSAWLEEMITLQYSSLRELTWELKGIGAHNVNSGRPVGLMGRQRMQAFMQGYEQQRNSEGLLPASYQVWYGVLGKPLLSDVIGQS
ncbi:malonyl-ACP O-methyltransferase BioC [Oceanicoccus sp. KOV_DT_Chl]|uniref:malonyl-ACP O-methyltransferase BioC n=1 Tax=Oceanicoccus sp. KOV_DT_Chl TaxID=1904639 RepID=UPI00190EB1A2|nr:malonyl-ACP O-methyltransferase BioC [Oceanicoccus sp. KOV_DT_Chl]